MGPGGSPLPQSKGASAVFRITWRVLVLPPTEGIL
jgi:hypothetical protein